MTSSFSQVKFAIGKILSAVTFEKARKPAYQLIIDFGPEFGTKQSSAQLTKGYADPAQLVGSLAVGILNFPRRLVAGFRSEVLILGFYADESSVKLMQPIIYDDQLVGKRIGLINADKFLLSSDEAEIPYSIFESLNICLGRVVEIENDQVLVSCGHFGLFHCTKNSSMTIQEFQKIAILTNGLNGFILATQLHEAFVLLATSDIVPEGAQLC